MAITALIIAAVPCCPFVNLVGAMLGVAALRRIHASRGVLGGRRLATTAIAIGLGLAVLLSGAWLAFSFREQQRLDAQMVNHIEGFIRAAQNGQSDKARSFWRPGASVNLSAADISAFGEESQKRYGRLERVSIASHSNSGSLLAPTIETACVFVFESSQRTGSAGFQLSISGNSIWPDLRLTKLRLDDPEHRPLALPAETP